MSADAGPSNEEAADDRLCFSVCNVILFVHIMVPRMCGIFVTRGLTRRVDGVVNVGKLLVLRYAKSYFKHEFSNTNHNCTSIT